MGRDRHRQARIDVSYDPNVPRCDTCVHFLQKTKAKRPQAVDKCRLHGFPVRAVAVCDTWFGRDGSTLEE